MPPLNGLNAVNFPNDLLYDAGIVMTGSSKLGVTKGAPNWNPNRTIDSIDFDGVFAPIKGADRIMQGEPTLAFSMLELGPAATGNQILKLEPGVTLASVAAPATPGTITATPSITGGALTAGTYYYKVTAVNAGGESLGSAEVSAAVASGVAGSVALSIVAVATATAYRWYRGTGAGLEDRYYQSASNAFTDVGAAVGAGAMLGTPPAGGSGTTTTYTPAVSGSLLAAGSYIADFRAIWERGNNAGYFAVYMPVALCNKYSIAGADKSQSLIAVEIVGRIDPATQLLSAPPYVLEFRTALP